MTPDEALLVFRLAKSVGRLPNGIYLLVFDRELAEKAVQELNAALGKSLGEKAKELIPKLGRTLLRAGPVVGPAMNVATGGIWGALTSGSADFAKEFFPEGESVEMVFQQLSKALAEQRKRIDLELIRLHKR